MVATEFVKMFVIIIISISEWITVETIEDSFATMLQKVSWNSYDVSRPVDASDSVEIS